MSESQERSPLQIWVSAIATYNKPTVLLTGAKRWEGSPPPSHEQYAPHATWIGTDIEAGEGVHIVGDLQSLDRTTDDKFDAIFSPATLEHIERPWTAMFAMTNMLRRGGLLYLHTHQTFPLHGYPNDFYRFSTEALKTLAHDAGLSVVSAAYDGPCKIRPDEKVAVWNDAAECYLNVTMVAEKR